MTACVIPHLWHVVQGARYQRQGGQHFNPHLYDDIKTIADHSHFTGNIRDSAWWGHEPELSDSISLAGGGHAHCGAMIYLADNWPDKYRNSIYFNNIHGNRINHDILERNGSGYVGHHGDDFLMANDKWYRGINLKYGPDGSVHLIDWYDKNACHRATPEIWDRSNGRIYRITYGNIDPVPVDLAAKSNSELARLQQHNNEWFVRHSRRLLQERSAQGESMAEVHAMLRKQLTQAPTAARRLRALWALHGTDGLDSTLLQNTLADKHDALRAWTIQLLVPELLPGQQPRAIPKETVAQLVKLASKDSSPLVRLYVASALQRIPLDQRANIAAALLQHPEDAADHNLPLMIWYGIEPLVNHNVSLSLKMAELSQIPLVSQFIVRRAAAETASLEPLLATIPHTPASQQTMILDEILQAFEGRVDIPMPLSWKATYAALLESDQAAIRDKADQIAISLGDKRLLPRMRDVLANPNETIQARQRALAVVLRGRDPEAAPALLKALDAPEIRRPAIRALAAYDHGETASALIQRYPNFDADTRRDAIGTLASRPRYALALLNAIQNETIARTDVHAYHVRQMRSFENDDVLHRLQAVWGTIRESSADKKKKSSLTNNSSQPKFWPQPIFPTDALSTRKLAMRVIDYSAKDTMSGPILRVPIEQTLTTSWKMRSTRALSSAKTTPCRLSTLTTDV